MTDRARLIPFIDSLAEARVLVVGDVMLDRFVTGAVERISPEAPIPVLRVTGETDMPGGAGNVVRNLTALGAQAIFVGVVGGDPAAERLRDTFNDDERADLRLIVDDGRRTTIKTRFVSGTQQMMRADREAGAPVSAAAAEEVLVSAADALGGCHALVLSDYDKGVLADGRAKALIDAAKDNGLPVIVDPKGDDYAIYAGADLITPNRKELEVAAGYPVNGDNEIVAAASRLIAAHGLGGMLVTRSADGMTLLDADGAAVHLAAETREVYDVSGAGDTVVAALSAMLAAKASRVDAATVANVAAGIAVGKVGTAAAFGSEVIAALHHQDISDAEAKVLTLAEAQDRVAQWRRQGLKIGFTNGCFDLLHPGHVSLLSQARATCDRLIVGLNSDASVKRLKGESRPVQNEAARATVLASLASVDTVTVFSEDTPLELIGALRPDVLIKGADYAVEDVVGGDLVTGWGGEVVLAELQPGHSTTSTIGRINDGADDG